MNNTTTASPLIDVPICLPKRTNTHINIQVYLYIHTSVCVTVCRYALQLHCGSLFPLPFPIIRTYVFVCKQVCCGGSGYSLGWLADSRYRLSASWLTVHVLDTCMCWFMDGVLQRTLNTHKHTYIYMHTYRHIYIYVYNPHLPAASHQLLAACHYYERLYWFDVALLLLLLLLLLLRATFNCT